MRLLARRLLAPLALAGLLGCGTVDPNLSLLTIEILNLNTATPAFDWPNQGTMNSVQLTTQADQQTVLWRVESPGLDGLIGPLTYGQPGPEGTVTTGTLAPLQRGVEYRVSIRQRSGIGGSGRFRLP